MRIGRDGGGEEMNMIGLGRVRMIGHSRVRMIGHSRVRTIGNSRVGLGGVLRRCGWQGVKRKIKKTKGEIERH